MELITITEKAQEKIRQALDNRNDSEKSSGVNAIRIGVRTKGCSGLSYTMEFLNEVPMGDEKRELDGFDLYVDMKAVMFVIGMKVDWIETDLEEGFDFSNGQEKGRCGCGESFFV